MIYISRLFIFLSSFLLDSINGSAVSSHKPLKHSFASLQQAIHARKNIFSQDFHSNYTFTRLQLGRGTNSIVYKGYTNKDHAYIAIKVGIVPPYMHSFIHRGGMLMEAYILKMAERKNIAVVKYINSGFNHDTGVFFIV